MDEGNEGASIIRTTAAAAVGGTASVLGGGKFKDGAWTGAFSRLFNDEASSKDPLLERARTLEEDPDFVQARLGAAGAASGAAYFHKRGYGVIVKEDRGWFERFTDYDGEYVDVENNKYSLTVAYDKTAYYPVQPEQAGYIKVPATIRNAVAVSIYRYDNSISVDYNAYARQINSPVYVSQGGGCTIYGSSSSSNC